MHIHKMSLNSTVLNPLCCSLHGQPTLVSLWKAYFASAILVNKLLLMLSMSLN